MMRELTLVQKILLAFRKLPLLIESRFDKNFLASDVSMSNIVSHEKGKQYLCETGNKQGLRVLGIGSREVNGESSFRYELEKAHYVGFDSYHGNNVDVVGDAH